MAYLTVEPCQAAKASRAHQSLSNNVIADTTMDEENIKSQPHLNTSTPATQHLTPALPKLQTTSPPFHWCT